MGIDCCKSCGKNFRYGEVLRSYWKWGKDCRSLKCHFCGQQHISTSGSDMLAYLILAGVPMFVAIDLGAGGVPRLYVYLGLILSTCGLSFLRPYIVRYQTVTDSEKSKKRDDIMRLVVMLVGLFLIVVLFKL